MPTPETPSTRSSEQISIVWFKRDLRINDHYSLWVAAQQGRVIPIYIIEPEYWKQADTSGCQWLFIRECLQSLEADLRKNGAPLIVRIGDATEVLSELVSETGVTHVFSHEEIGNLWTFERDKSVGQMLREIGCEWTEYAQFGVQRGPTNRDKWSKAWDAFMALPQIETPGFLSTIVDIPSADLPAQTDLGLSDICPKRQKGGRERGLLTLDSLLTERGANYRTGMSSPISAQWECSRLSTFLSTGTVSMREAAQTPWSRQRELKAMASEGEETGPWRGSTSSFNGRLHWHCPTDRQRKDLAKAKASKGEAS